jgi:hypothetical protein
MRVTLTAYVDKSFEYVRSLQLLGFTCLKLLRLRILCNFCSATVSNDMQNAIPSSPAVQTKQSEQSWQSDADCGRSAYMFVR